MKAKKRTFLIFVNPKGGKGMAKKMWFNSGKPMLKHTMLKTISNAERFRCLYPSKDYPCAYVAPLKIFPCVSVKPMMDVAGIVSEVVYTEYSGHAGDYVRECKDIYKYTSIMTLSGSPFKDISLCFSFMTLFCDALTSP